MTFARVMRYPPPIVAQVDPLHIAGERLIALPVGVVPWDPEHERTTIVVKTTYGFDIHADQPQLVLLEEQPALSANEAEPPIDLVRTKPRADVILVGHAHAPRAVDRIDARLRLVGQLDLAFSTVGPTPIERMPLTAGHLRDPDGTIPIPPVGPMPAREVIPLDEQEDAYGLTNEEKLEQYRAAMAALSAGDWKPWEDAGVEAPRPPVELFDVAPESQPTVEGGALEPVPGPMWDDLYRTESITERGVQFAAAHLNCRFPEPDAVFELSGLLPGGHPRRLTLPGHDVLVIAEASAKYDVSMEIDTVHIDTDRGRVALTWRGQVPEDIFARSSVRLLVCLGHVEEVPEVDDIYRNLPRGIFERAAASPNTDVGALPRTDVELNVARQMTFDRTPDPMLSLDEYTDLVAEIAARPSHRGEVLARRGMDTTDWMLEERAWMEAVGKALQRGDLEAVDAYNKMITAKRRVAKAKEGDAS